MKISKLFATISAVAVAATGLSALNVSAAEQIGQAYFIGQLGGDQCWNAEDFASPVAIDGDAQYEVEWTLTAGGTDTVQFLAVCIAPTGTADNFTTDSFPNLSATIDEVWVDGSKISYTASADAIETAYYEGGTGVTRLYLHDEWAGTGVADLPGNTAIGTSIKVVFTISGTGVEGTSNIASEETVVTTTTAAANDDTVTTTTAAAAEDDNTATTTTAAGNGESSADSVATTTAAAGNAATGVEGVASVVALLTIAGVAVVATKKH